MSAYWDHINQLQILISQQFDRIPILSTDSHHFVYHVVVFNLNLNRKEWRFPTFSDRTCGKHHQLHSCHLVLRPFLPAVACCRRAGRLCHSWGPKLGFLGTHFMIIWWSCIIWWYVFGNWFYMILLIVWYIVSGNCWWKKMIIFKTRDFGAHLESREPGEPKFADLHWWLGLLLWPAGTQRASQSAQREDRLWGAFLSLANSYQGGECGFAGPNSGQCIWDEFSWLPGWCLADLQKPRRRLCRGHLHWHGPLLCATRCPSGRAAAGRRTCPWPL